MEAVDLEFDLDSDQDFDPGSGPGFGLVVQLVVVVGTEVRSGGSFRIVGDSLTGFVHLELVGPAVEQPASAGRVGGYVAVGW